MRLRSGDHEGHHGGLRKAGAGQGAQSLKHWEAVGTEKKMGLLAFLTMLGGTGVDGE